MGDPVMPGLTWIRKRIVVLSTYYLMEQVSMAFVESGGRGAYQRSSTHIRQDTSFSVSTSEPISTHSDLDTTLGSGTLGRVIRSYTTSTPTNDHGVNCHRHEARRVLDSIDRRLQLSEIPNELTLLPHPFDIHLASRLPFSRQLAQPSPLRFLLQTRRLPVVQILVRLIVQEGEYSSERRIVRYTHEHIGMRIETLQLLYTLRSSLAVQIRGLSEARHFEERCFGRLCR
jgi:hypothetical protein